MNEWQTMNDEAKPALRIEVTDAVIVTTLHRPDRRNTIDFDTCVELRQRLAGADADKTARAIVIAGNDRDFCTGPT